jgi:hypothetical protein
MPVVHRRLAQREREQRDGHNKLLLSLSNGNVYQVEITNDFRPQERRVFEHRMIV